MPIREPLVLKGWKQISTFLKVSEKTARRWANEHGLPVRRNPRPIAVRADLTRWIYDGARKRRDG